jgi:hypothetical protein
MATENMVAPQNFIPDDWANAHIPANPPASAIGNNRHRALAYCLGQCGFDRREVCAFISFGGFDSLVSLLDVKDEDLDQLAVFKYRQSASQYGTNWIDNPDEKTKERNRSTSLGIYALSDQSIGSDASG